MAKNRSRRLRKNAHIDEFRELDFRWHGDSRKVHRKNRLIKPLMILLTRSSNRTNWPLTAAVIWPREGLICMQEIGKCTEEHQAIVRKWLEERKLDEVRTSELFDVWWD